MAPELEAGGEADAEELAHRACAVRELREEAGIELPGDAELLPWSRWITPELVPGPLRHPLLRRARAAPLPAASPTARRPPRPPGSRRATALDRHAAGELSLVFPTIKHLESLLPYSSAEEVLAAARGRRIEPILPRVVGKDEERRVVLPGEPGY